jgi:hypothetical protein
MREPLKRTAGACLALAPQARFARCLFLIGHMRCGSTALSNVLCAHPRISGYGETHVRYDRRSAPGALLLNQLRRGRWKPRNAHLFDKLLHDELDAAPPPAFFTGRAIFLSRPPAAAVPSILRLFRALGSPEYATPADAAAYYTRRLVRMRALWHAFPAERRIAVRHEDLVADPAATLERLSRFLRLTPALSNAYAEPKPLPPGAGDPLAAHRMTAIVPVPADSRPIPIPDAAMALAHEAWRSFVATTEDRPA